MVYVLSARNNPASASAAQRPLGAEFDNALSRLGACSARELRNQEAMAVLNSFYAEAKRRQIPLKDLGGNAFLFKPPTPEPLVLVDAP